MMSRREERIEEIKERMDAIVSERVEISDTISEKESERDSIELDADDFTDQYDEMIDECSEEVTVFGSTWNASYVLKTMDEIAYNMGLNEYVDELDVAQYSDEYKELQEEIDSLEDQLLDLDSEQEDLEQELSELLEEEDEE